MAATLSDLSFEMLGYMSSCKASFVLNEPAGRRSPTMKWMCENVHVYGQQAYLACDTKTCAKFQCEYGQAGLWCSWTVYEHYKNKCYINFKQNVVHMTA